MCVALRSRKLEAKHMCYTYVPLVYVYFSLFLFFDIHPLFTFNRKEG